jgi:hypothetical protein
MKYCVNTDAIGKGLPMVSAVPALGLVPQPPPKGGGFGGINNPNLAGTDGTDQVLVPTPGCTTIDNATNPADEELARILDAANNRLNGNR